MASFSLPKLCKVALVSLVLISIVVVAASFQFKVGGERGWTKPTGNESETYNEWATMNRFQTGDSLCKFTIYTFVYNKGSLIA